MFSLSSRKKCYCAFCKSERTLFTKRRIGLINVLGAGVASLVVMMGIWQTFDPRLMLIFVVFLAVAECFVQIRWRLNIVCKHCGFDPVLYLKNAEQAAEKAKAFLDRRSADPASLLKPALKIPIRYKKSTPDEKSAESKGSKGSFVSKQI